MIVIPLFSDRSSVIGKSLLAAKGRKGLRVDWCPEPISDKPPSLTMYYNQWGTTYRTRGPCLRPYQVCDPDNPRDRRQRNERYTARYSLYVGRTNYPKWIGSSLRRALAGYIHNGPRFLVPHYDINKTLGGIPGQLSNACKKTGNRYFKSNVVFKQFMMNACSSHLLKWEMQVACPPIYSYNSIERYTRLQQSRLTLERAQMCRNIVPYAQ